MIPFVPAANGNVGPNLWRRALKIPDLLDKSGGPAHRRTAVSMLHDGKYLRFAFDCALEGSEVPKADAPSFREIWGDDWVAVAADPRGLGFSAYFFVLNANGVTAEGATDANGQPRQVRFMNWTGAVRRTNSGWSAEFAIPLVHLAFRVAQPPQLALRALRFFAQAKREAELPGNMMGLPDAPRFRLFSLGGSNAIRSAAAHYAQDLKAEFAAKARAIAESGDATLDARVVAFGDASVFDYRLFPSSALQPNGSRPPGPDGAAAKAVARNFNAIDYAPGRKIQDVEAFLTETQGTSLVVFRNGRVEAEWYANGFSSESVFTSFSVAKSFVSTLVGIAVDKGAIQSEDDPVVRYVPELLKRDARFAQISLSSLMHMASGLAYEENAGAHDNQRTYMDPDLRRAALEHSRILKTPGTEWLYNNYNPLLIGLVLERATGRSVTELTQDWLWTPLRMAYSASWSLDSRASRFEKMESGINSHPLDFAKLGALFLDGGVANGERIVSERWVRLATQPLQGKDRTARPGNDFYGLYWWIARREDGPSDFYALGNKGQCVYCAPAKKLVLVKTGVQHGLKPHGWPKIFRAFSDAA